MNRTDWPLGVALKRERERAGLSVRAAARRTRGAVSSGRWYQLESGYQKAGGHNIPIGTTPATVAAAAQAIGWDVEEALRAAGFDPLDIPTAKPSPLRSATTDELLAEIRRRIESAVGAEGDDVSLTAADFTPADDESQDGENTAGL